MIQWGHKCSWLSLSSSVCKIIWTSGFFYHKLLLLCILGSHLVYLLHLISTLWECSLYMWSCWSLVLPYLILLVLVLVLTGTGYNKLNTLMYSCYFSVDSSNKYICVYEYTWDELNQHRNDSFMCKWSSRCKTKLFSGQEVRWRGRRSEWQPGERSRHIMLQQNCFIDKAKTFFRWFNSLIFKLEARCNWNSTVL